MLFITRTMCWPGSVRNPDINRSKSICPHGIMTITLEIILLNEILDVNCEHRNRHQDVPSCRCQCGRRHGSYSLANKEQRCSLFTANMVGTDMERKYFSGLTNIYASFYSHYTTWHCLFLPFSRFPEHDLARKMVKNAGSSTHKNGIQNESTKQLIGCQRLQWHNTTSKTERLVSGKRQ